MSNLSEGRDILTETLTLHNDISEVPQLNDFIEAVAERLGIEPSTALQLQLAVEEAVVNVMDYAYPPGTKGDVCIEAVAGDNGLVITITDNGTPFDPTTRGEVDTTLPAEQRSIGGLGIMLMRRYMDSTEYKREGDRNILTLTKKRTN